MAINTKKKARHLRGGALFVLVNKRQISLVI
jgi:hypothetical protein